MELFKEFFNGYTDKFLWAFNDAYEEQHVGQLGWAFSMLMLHKFGEEFRQVNFYAEKYLDAFPSFLDAFANYGRDQDDFRWCYGVRTFDRFLLWFGLVELKTDRKYPGSDNDQYRQTSLVNKVFRFDET